MLCVRHACRPKLIHKSLEHRPRIWGGPNDQSVEYSRKIEIVQVSIDCLVEWQIIDGLGDASYNFRGGQNEWRWQPPGK